MALIEVYHVVADYYPVFQTDYVTQGMAVGLYEVNGETFARPAASTDYVVGIAGDSDEQDGSGANAYSANVVVAAGRNTDGTSYGATRSTQNRVADQGNETLASGKLTVYTSGGKFRTNQIDSTSGAFVVGQPLYLSNTQAGKVTSASTSGKIIGTIVETLKAFPSGVPGTEVDGSTSLGNFVTFILNTVA